MESISVFLVTHTMHSEHTIYAIERLYKTTNVKLNIYLYNVSQTAPPEPMYKELFFYSEEFKTKLDAINNFVTIAADKYLCFSSINYITCWYWAEELIFNYNKSNTHGLIGIKEMGYPNLKLCSILEQKDTQDDAFGIYWVNEQLPILNAGLTLCSRSNIDLLIKDNQPLFTIENHENAILSFLFSLKGLNNVYILKQVLFAYTIKGYIFAYTKEAIKTPSFRKYVESRKIA